MSEVGQDEVDMEVREVVGREIGERKEGKM